MFARVLVGRRCGWRRRAHSTALLQTVQDAIAPMVTYNRNMVVSRQSPHELTIDLGEEHGCYTVMSRTDDQDSVVLSSPTSGVHTYLYDHTEQHWKSTKDSHILTDLLTRELLKTCQGYPSF